MKKILMLLLCLTALYAWAANEITIVPDATVHNGGAAGDPAGFIDGSGKLDISGMTGASELLVFDVVISNLDFTLAGYEFKIDYPVNLTMLSTTAADWQNGTGAIYSAAGYTASGAVQWLPADGNGDRTAGTVDNINGIVRVGMLWTNAGDRPVGDGLGGDVMIGKISFLFDATNATCTSGEEQIEITVTSADPSIVPEADIFADDSANRVVVGSVPAVVMFGDPSANVRADGNNDGSRSPADLLIAANCSIFGNNPAHPNCSVSGGWDWSTDPKFIQTFDYNCDGVVSPADLLGNARLTIGVGNRTSFKTLDHYTVDAQNGALSIKYDQTRGLMSHVLFKYQGLQIAEPTISEKAIQEGWTLIYDLGPETLSYAIFNMSMVETAIPEVTIQYKGRTGGKIAVADTMTQAGNLEFLSIQPKIEDNSRLERPEKPIKQNRQD